MNLNGDEKRIQRLFREIRIDDQRRAPQFDGVLEAAISGRMRSRDRVWAMRLALVVATLIVIAFVAAAVIRHGRSGTTGSPEQQAVVEPDSTVLTPDSTNPRQVRASVPPRGAKQIRHRRPTLKPMIDVTSLFAWQSPTASLLKAPGDDLLMSLPRLGESLKTIKTFSPDHWN